MMDSLHHNVIDFEWIKTPSGHEYLDSLIQNGKRRHFGLLERPSLPPHKDVDCLNFKIVLTGKSGVGKSAAIAKLAGFKILKQSYENVGIETTMVYWPVRLTASGQILFLRLHFWDVGEGAIKKFDNILPAFKSEVDCVLFTFSFTDQQSFRELNQRLNSFLDEGDKDPVRILLGTKADQYINSDISEPEITNFSQARNVPVLRIKSVPSSRNYSNGRESMYEVAPLLNRLCDLLLQRDKILSNS
ncbi:ciliogenesis and planar polarity effector 2-like [Clavelina lepadiformis]|uniref:ciliogenesis and planar polarity effector 2-like n=1 Tax=Clavelina lepadiformis TaxID=159417 RepID=UPI004041C31A